jgi:putative photosynthetic complex assembly protein
MSHHHSQTVPRGVLIGAGVIILLTLALAAAARSAHLTEGAVALPAPLESLDVRFEDRADGSIGVLDAASGREVSVIAPRENGFIRGVLRGMFRARKQEALGRDGTFRLAREADGRLSLEDPQTGRRMDLDSFGPTNSSSFAQLLAAGRQAAAIPTR